MIQLKLYAFKKYLWILLCITPFLSFSLGYITIGKLFRAKTYPTPAIIGKKLQEAVSILSEHKLHIKFLAQKEEPDLPSGMILNQKPTPGRKIKPNQSVYVVISKKPNKIVFPNVVGKHIDNISKKLNTKNIKNRSYYLPSNYPLNHCIAQYPAPGTQLKKNNTITYLSQGNKKPVILPNFKNKELKPVLEFLQDYNVKIEIRSQNNKNPKDIENLIICDQRPLAGSIVNLHNEKELLIHLKTRI